MVYAMKELIPRYWGTYRMNGQEPMPLEPDDKMLRQIYNYSTKNENFRPIEVIGINGKTTLVDPQCDAEEWMTYFLGECREATDKEVVQIGRPATEHSSSLSSKSDAIAIPAICIYPETLILLSIHQEASNHPV
jgi:hypothetical protein